MSRYMDNLWSDDKAEFWTRQRIAWAVEAAYRCADAKQADGPYAMLEAIAALLEECEQAVPVWCKECSNAWGSKEDGLCDLCRRDIVREVTKQMTKTRWAVE